MIEGDEAAFEFLVSHEQLAEAIEPTVANLDDPAASLLFGIPPFGLSLFGTVHDVGDVPMRLDDFQCRLASIPRIRTEMLATSNGGDLSLNLDGVEHRADLRHVMHIGPGHDERQGDATPVHQQMALAAFFSPDPSGWGRRLPAPSAL